MPDLGIDFAWTKPDPAAVVAAGYKFVLGYISHDDSKDMSAAQIAAYRAAGLQVYLIYETTADRALAGQAAGASDALEAASKAADRGYPTTLPIFLTDDTNTTADQVRPYFQGSRSVLGPRSGGYGGIHVVDPLLQDGTILWGFQACAWSGNAVSQYAHLYQRLRPTLKATFTDFDEDVLLRPLPKWPLVSAPAPIPTPDPAPPIQPSSEDSMWPYMIQVTDGQDINWIVYNYGNGKGPQHIDGPKAAELNGSLGGAKVPVVRLSYATFASQFPNLA